MSCLVQKSTSTQSFSTRHTTCTSPNSFGLLCSRELCHQASTCPALQTPIKNTTTTTENKLNGKQPNGTNTNADEVWVQILSEAQSEADDEPILRKLYYDAVLSHTSLESALSAYLASKLSHPSLLPAKNLQDLLYKTYQADPIACRAVRADLNAALERDPACARMVHCFLYYKGFLALQAHRAAHRLWADGRSGPALMLQSRVSEVFAVDIHPGARIGGGVLLDHATGVVIGETAVVGDNVSMLHGVTLGGTGKQAGDRHPKVGDGVLLGARASILGNLRIGAGAKVGAGAVVLSDVPSGATAVGSPARLINKKAG